LRIFALQRPRRRGIVSRYPWSENHQAGQHFELDRFIETNFVLVKRGSDVESLGVGMQFDAWNTATPR